MWILSSIAANLCIAVLEYIYRTNSLSAGLALKIVPLVIFMQLMLWHTWRAGPSLMLAWGVFTLGNTVLRVVNTHFMICEPMNTSTWLALTLIMTGVFVMHYGKG